MSATSAIRSTPTPASPGDALEQLVAACRAVRQRCPTLGVQAIPWIHFTNTREAVHRQMAQQRSLPILCASLPRLAWLLVRSVQYAGRMARLRWRCRTVWRRLCATPFPCVAKSWWVGTTNGNGSRDFYLGDLADQLRTRAIPLLTLHGNATGRDWRQFAREEAAAGPLDRLPELCLIAPWRIGVMLINQIVTSVRLLWCWARGGSPLERRVLLRASVDCLRVQTLTNGLYYWIGQAVVRYWRPKAVVLLYEGFAWEECFVRGIRSRDPECRILGYQHTVILPRAVDLYRPLTGGRLKTTPDLVLTTGGANLALLQPGHLPCEATLLRFGSFRAAARRPTQSRPDPARRTVLVLPEGILEEARLLFGTAIRAAAHLPDHRFLFRCHPILPFATVEPHLPADWRAHGNVEVSTNPTIEADFARASVALYRGSSAILYAIAHGLKAYYLDEVATERIDPLFALEGWREAVASDTALVESLRSYAEAPVSMVLSAWQVAADTIAEYAIPVEPHAMDQLVEAAGWGRG